MIVFIYLVQLAQCKITTTTVSLSSDNPWKYVSKFAPDKGISTWQMKAKFAKPVNQSSEEFGIFKGSVYIDTKWQDALSQSSCEAQEKATQRYREISIPLNGEWSKSVDGTMVTKDSYHFWYFALSSCSISQRQKVKVEIQFTQPDGSQFSIEEQGLNNIFIAVLVIFLIFLYRNLKKLISNFKKTDNLEIHLLILNIAIACEFIAILCEVVHLWIYSSNGKGLGALDVFYQIFDSLSSISITILLIIISTGWTIKYKDFPDFELLLPICFLVVVLNIMIIGLGRITQDASNKNSDFECVPGYILIVIRILMWIWFIFNSKDLYVKASCQLENFLNRFVFVSSMYFVALPIVIIASWFLEPYRRNAFVVVGVNTVQVIVFFYLTHLFSEKSAFYKVSTISESVLPGKMQ
ncbi:hypothetical protein SteCoe_10541 [Stentor coeruleus]|uniref:GPR180/TMEM145 transmembrane domain-containing protein n=1 Tax=Stentor coeruleus TaxID=5963 RepID=A0A1R2CF92_9CILI|nr:hypothetical protein SteCoe_10541 [Stentor coeruleus]